MQGQESEIKNSTIGQPTYLDPTKFRTNIIANACIWKESLEVEYTLQQNPIVGQSYFVHLNAPLQLHLNMELWLYYDCPLAFYNGYEQEAEIEKANFCWGQIIKIMTYNDLGAIIEFKVTKILTLNDILKINETRELPEFWTEFLLGFINRKDLLLETFGKYYKLSVSAQGDLGLNCIITNYENELVICMVNEWNFDENTTFGGKFKLPEKIKEIVIEKNDSNTQNTIEHVKCLFGNG